MRHTRLLWISVLFAVILPSLALAQSMTVGAKIGGGLSFLNGSDWKDTLDWYGGDNKVRFGFTMGVFSSFEIVPGFCIQPEIAYSRIGGAYAYTYYEPAIPANVNVDGKVTANALEVPVLLMGQYDAGKGKFRIFAGPELVLILGDIEQKEKAAGMTVSVDIEPDNHVVLGVKGGIGGTYPLGRGDVVLDLSYTRTITKIFEDDNTAFNGLLLTAGYQIRIK